MKYSGINLQTA